MKRLPLATLNFPTLTFATLTLALSASAFGHASDADYSLVYRNADFATYENVRDLHQRIVKTAKAHCPSYFTTRSLSDVNTCVRDVVENLVRSIDNPRLTAYDAGQPAFDVASEVNGDSASS
ncbi:MAG: UrcA family protein [Pseudomonadales bacterium]|nr:UrcA family protein [Pseudomonadales bacterium]MCP5185524.1 UrcA family protein [Pseudomonadales bacterium]